MLRQEQPAALQNAPTLTHPSLRPEGRALAKVADVLPALDPGHDRGLLLSGRAQCPAARDDGRGRAMGRNPGALPVRAALFDPVRGNRMVGDAASRSQLQPRLLE